eukprot:m51a1_g4326 putative exocyst complex subunit 2 (1008) ;mRNA; r:92070-95695
MSASDLSSLSDDDFDLSSHSRSRSRAPSAASGAPPAAQTTPRKQQAESGAATSSVLTTWAEVATFLEDEAREAAIKSTTVVSTTAPSGPGASPRSTTLSGDDEDDDLRDPLGIVPAREVRVLRANEKMRIETEGFAPRDYLTAAHSRTPFKRLVVSLDALTRRLDNKREAIKELVRANFDHFISCKDTIDVIHEQVVESVVGDDGVVYGGGTGASALDRSYAALLADANRVFELMLARKGEIERIRASVGALDRSKFIFRLPSTLRQAVARGDDEKAVQTYFRARSLLENAQNSLFRRVLAECETIAAAFRAQLYRILEDPLAGAHEHDRVVGILSQLGAGEHGDPLQYYMAFHRARIQRELDEAEAAYRKATEDRAPKATAAVDPKITFVRDISEVLVRNLPQHYNLLALFVTASEQGEVEPEQRRSRFLPGALPSALMGQFRAQKHRMVRVHFDNDSTAIVKVFRNMTAANLCQHLRTVGENVDPKAEYALFVVTTFRDKKDTVEEEVDASDRPYLIHKKWGDKTDRHFLFKRVRRATQPAAKKLPRTQDKEPRALARDKSVDDLKALPHEAMVKELRDLCVSYASKVADVFQRMVDSETLGPDPLGGEGLTGEEDLMVRYTILQQVLLEMRQTVVTLEEKYLLPHSPVAPIEDAHDRLKAAFVRRVCDEAKSTAALLHSQEDWAVLPNSQTALPGYFGRTVYGLLELLDAVLLPDDALQEQVATDFACAAAQFVDSLHHLAFEVPHPPELEGRRLLLVMANCVYCRKELFPDLLHALGFETGDSEGREVRRTVEDLERMVRRRYIQHHAVALSASLREAVAESSQDWLDAPAPSDVQDFVYEALVTLVNAQAQVVELAPRCVGEVMSDLLVQTLQAFKDAAMALPAVGANGAVQLAADVEFVCEALAAYSSPDSVALAASCKSLLGTLTSFGGCSSPSPSPQPGASTSPAQRRRKQQLGEGEGAARLVCGPAMLQSPQARAVIAQALETARQKTRLLFSSFQQN